MDGLVLKKCSAGVTSSSQVLPSPKSPPSSMWGKRKELLRVQMLEREISFLEEELKACEGLQVASRSCKEVDEFVMANPDPLIPTNRKIHRSCCSWKWLCGKSFFSLSWMCCFKGCCSRHSRTRRCSTCGPPENKWSSQQTHCSGGGCCCFGKMNCRTSCRLPAPLCRMWCCLDCRKVCCCFNCRKNCCSH